MLIFILQQQQPAQQQDGGLVIQNADGTSQVVTMASIPAMTQGQQVVMVRISRKI